MAKRGTKSGKSTKKIKNMPLSAKKTKGVRGGNLGVLATGHEKWIEGVSGWIENTSPFGRKI